MDPNSCIGEARLGGNMEAILNPQPSLTFLQGQGHPLQELQIPSFSSFIAPGLLSKGYVTNYHKLGGLKQPKWIPSQFQRLDSCNQGASTVVPSGGPERESLFPVSLLASGSF
jgi:hypothetical protein